MSRSRDSTSPFKWVVAQSPSEVVERLPLLGVEFAVSLPASQEPFGITNPVSVDCSADRPDDPTCSVESLGKMMNVLFRSPCLRRLRGTSQGDAHGSHAAA